MNIKALSLWQPWATAINVHAKQNETRSWPTKHRGWLAIHAAKRKIDKSDQGFVDFAEYAVGNLDALDFGAVVCVVYLYDCRPAEAVVDEICEDEELWGNYGPNRWAWMFRHGLVLDIQPAIPVRGRQGLFDWSPPDHIAETIREFGSL